MRRVLIAATGSFTALWLGVSMDFLGAQSGCDQCRPPRLNRNWNIEQGSHTICFKSTSVRAWSSGERTAMESGINYWGGLLSEDGRNVSLSYVHRDPGQSCPTDSITIETVEPSGLVNSSAAGEANGNSNGRGANIKFNVQHVNQSTWNFAYTAGHDFGHLLDFDDMRPGDYPADCATKTIMYWEHNPLPSNPCGDRLGVAARYDPPPEDPPGGGEECDDCTFQANGPGECSEDGGYFIEECMCCVDPWSPIAISLDGGLKFSSAAGGVVFDLASTGAPRRIPWPRTAGDVWLVLDRNGNGTIDDGREMFGNFTRLADGTPAPNGYVALAELDTTGDGRLTAADVAFGQLRLWLDRVRNGVTDTGELITLGDAGITELSLRYKESKRTDRWGNVFKYRSNVRFSSGDMRHAWDVYFPVPPREIGSSSLALASTPRQCRTKAGLASAIARMLDLR
jgi:hypothetical protein